MADIKVVFLHIPKTAGQSIHAALIDAFGADTVCPARMNEQLTGMPLSDLNRYRVFSGHLDLSVLEGLEGPKFVFTILRKPLDRILSFYFFLREEGGQLAPDERAKPHRQGLKAAFELDPNEYFRGAASQLRNFIDDHFDNFYAYFFAGHAYRARNELLARVNRGELTRDDVVDMAKANLDRLDGVYAFDRLGDVFQAICQISGKSNIDEHAYRTNVNEKLAQENRMVELSTLGADAKTLARLEDFCRMDNEIWSAYAGGGVGKALGPDLARPLDGSFGVRR